MHELSEIHSRELSVAAGMSADAVVNVHRLISTDGLQPHLLRKP